MASRLRRLSLYRFYSKLDLRPDGCPTSGALGQAYHDDTDRYFAQYCRRADLTRGGCALISEACPAYLPMRIKMPAISARMPRMTTGMASVSAVAIP